MRNVTVTVSCSGGKCLASIQTQRELKPALPKVASAIGVDIGVARFARTAGWAHRHAPKKSWKFSTFVQ